MYENAPTMSPLLHDMHVVQSPLNVAAQLLAADECHQVAQGEEVSKTYGCRSCCRC